MFYFQKSCLDIFCVEIFIHSLFIHFTMVLHNQTENVTIIFTNENSEKTPYDASVQFEALYIILRLYIILLF